MTSSSTMLRRASYCAISAALTAGTLGCNDSKKAITEKAVAEVEQIPMQIEAAGDDCKALAVALKNLEKQRAALSRADEKTGQEFKDRGDAAVDAIVQALDATQEKMKRCAEDPEFVAAME